MTLQANELRVGNKLYFNDIVCGVKEIRNNYLRVAYFRSEILKEHISLIEFAQFKPIPLTEEWLLKCPNHKKVNGKNILNTIYFEIGRNRVISIGNIGTGNEAIWLCEIDPNIENRITDLVCIHNFDYDGKIMLHKFQNIFHSLTNTELTVNL